MMTPHSLADLFTRWFYLTLRLALDAATALQLKIQY